MDIVINLEPFYEFLNLPADIMIWRLYLNFGWLAVAFVFLWGAKEVWLFYIQKKWSKTQKHIFLAIDIPRGNEQSPRAVENLFTYLAGAHSTINLVEKYWTGAYQLSFSFEIVSIDGYTQFIIRSPEQFRSLVESAVYSQYPDAEINEIDDYAKDAPTKFPNEEYDVWGAEFIQKNNLAFPIKVYKDFEHQFGEPETQYKDPMSALMDLCSSLKRGEQLWYQIILKPMDMFKWTVTADKEVDKILGQKEKNNFFDELTNAIMSFLDGLSDAFYNLIGTMPEVENKKKEEDILKMINLPPKQKKQVEAIHNKTSKVAFEVKIRFVYLAKKDVMNKPKVANGFVGYMKQFTEVDLNNLKPDMDKTATSVAYFFKESRLNSRKYNIVFNYKNRDGSAGRKMGILNVEELASIWHFPIESVVKAPFIEKSPGRKAEPPIGIPIIEESGNRREIPTFDLDILGAAEQENGKDKKRDKIIELKKSRKGEPPENLPFV
jgi:hypothetical protein